MTVAFETRKVPVAALSASQVLVTVGTASTMSAVGGTETHRAVVTRSPLALAFAAFDAGFVVVDLERSRAEAPRFVVASGPEAGQGIGVEQIDQRWGERLRARMGIRQLEPGRKADHVLSDIAAPLPHDLEAGGLRRLMGLGFDEVRHSSFKDMFGLFQDDPRLAPSLQSLLFLYGGIGALAGLPVPLSTLLPAAHRFRVVAACAFAGNEHWEHMSLGMQPRLERVEDKKNDKLAYRLSASLTTHGPALLNTVLAPVYNLSKVRRSPELLQGLRRPGSPLRNVPQAPLVSNAACASAQVAFCDIAAQMVLGAGYPGLHAPDLILWTSADTALLPDARVLEAFGLGAMMTREKLDELNAGRSESERRSVAESLAPFDVDAQGTIVGHAGSGMVVTTLDFAVRHGLDITSLIVGWGQSGETGGKGHFAGVGFGGENAIIHALTMAREAHGYGVGDFRHLVAHATGTRTNSRTDLTAVHEARLAAQELAGGPGVLPRMTVGAPKSIGDAHTMGETGLRCTSEAVRYVCGDTSVGIPTLRRVDPELGAVVEYFQLSASPVPGDIDGGALVPTQGFGGYDGALALRAAHPEALRRYRFSEPALLDAYLERWPELRRERIEREARARRAPGFVRQLIDRHCWPAGTG